MLSLPSIHSTYRKSQTNLSKALVSSLYPLAQAFPLVLPLSSNIKFCSPTAEALWNQVLPASVLSLYSPAQSILWSGRCYFSRLCMNLCSVVLVPPLGYGYVAALIWSLLHILLIFPNWMWVWQNDLLVDSQNLRTDRHQVTWGSPKKGGGRSCAALGTVFPQRA